jgi:alpha-L-fucosidase
LDRDWETCQTINWSWGYNKTDNSWKSADVLVHMLLETVSKGGNLLLNVGPTAQGVIPAPSVDRLTAMGSWLNQYGETVYGSLQSPIQKFGYGRVTFKNDNYYLHLFSIPVSNKIQVPFSVSGQAMATAYKTDMVLPLTVGDNSVEIDVAGVDRDPYATVITFQAKGEPINDDFVRASPDGSFTLNTDYAFIVGTQLRIEPQGNLGFWTLKEDYVYWKIQIDRPGAYQVAIEYAVDGCCGDNRVAVKLNEQVLRFTGKVTGGWQTYKTFQLGTLNIPSGMQTLTVMPDGNNGAYINLLHIYLYPEEGSAVEGNDRFEPVSEIKLYPSFPNPVNGTATLRYSLPSEGPVHYTVYDLSGRIVETSPSTFFQAGEHQVQLDVSRWPTGAYFFVLNAGHVRICQKIISVK